MEHPTMSLAAGSPDIQTIVTGFLTTTPKPSEQQVSNFLQLFSTAEDRDLAAKLLVTGGADATAVAAAHQAAQNVYLRLITNQNSVAGNALSLVSAAASAFHGYRRNQSIGWAVWWFFMGSIFPVFTPVIAIAQGYGKRKGQ